MTLERLRRMQWVLRAALVFALLLSMVANVLHAEDDPIARVVAGWSPLALFVAIDVMMRVPIRSPLRAALRITSTTLIAGIAAWTSYWHMVGVVARYESGLVPYLLPISVDGLIVVLSVSLFDVASQIRERLDIPTNGALLAAAQEVIPGVEQHLDASMSPPAGTTAADPARLDEHDGDDGTDPDPHDDDGREEPDTHDEADSDAGAGPDGAPSDTDHDGGGLDLAGELAALLPAARVARDELLHEGSTVSRDALAARLRRNGTAIRNTRVSELLAALKAETGSVNGSRPRARV